MDRRTMVQNKVILKHQILHFPTSLGVSEVSERANEFSGAQERSEQCKASSAKRAVQSKRMSERCERRSERTSEWPSTYVFILCCSRPHWDGRTDGPTDRRTDGRTQPLWDASSHLKRWIKWSSFVTSFLSFFLSFLLSFLLFLFLSFFFFLSFFLSLFVSFFLSGDLLA